MEAKKTPAAKPQVPQDKPQGKIAVVLVRNTTAASGGIRDSLTMLRLQKKFTCTVVDNTRQNRGMLNKVKDYTTFGDVSDDTIKLLETKRGEKGADGKIKNCFHLSPPRGGFERKGIKHNFEQGGALGARGSRMNDLLKKMI